MSAALEDEHAATALREQALLATGLSVSITDPHQPDNPLVWVNPAFTHTTGYSFEEAIGRNCRFLQGPGTDRAAVAEIHRCLELQQSFTATLLNYRKDGSTFWNEMSISPIRDDGGQVTHYVCVQADVTARVDAQRARDAALAQVAQTADQLAMLADFTTRLAMCQHPRHVMRLIADELVPRVGTWCVVCTIDEAGHLTMPQIRHERQADPQVRQLLRELAEVAPEQLLTNGPMWRVLRGERPFVLLADYDAAPPAASGSAPDERTALATKLGVRSIVVVPLLARGCIVGCIGLSADDSRPPLGAVELSLVRDLATRAGLMLENTKLAARQRAAAATLQRSLLPRLAPVPGVEVAAAYVPSANEAAVGGDWYDVFALRDGDGSRSVGVVVGDVMGHNIDSAARMGKLSTIVRSYAWPGSAPRDVLTAVDELLQGTRTKVLATCMYGRLSPTETGARLRYASAGHPAAIVRHPDGRVELLDGGRGPMLGVSHLLRAGPTHPLDAIVDVARGGTVVCFTDGLLDAFGEENDTGTGLAEMCQLLAGLPAGARPQAIVDAFTAAGRTRLDDVAMIAIRIG